MLKEKMETRNFKVNSQLLPNGFPREFDAHIYFETKDLEKATLLRNKIKEHFKSETFFVGDMITIPIGPHPLPMFETNFPKEIFTEVVLWLMKERGDFNVLVHPLSGDDYYDHTQGAMWLGQAVNLDYSKFKKIISE